MASYQEPQCLTCQKLISDGGGKLVCQQYKAIPQEIYYQAAPCKYYQQEAAPAKSADTSPVCSYCKNLLQARVCKAFPDGIPDAIWAGQNGHTSPVKGDHGILFDPIITPTGTAKE